jgi:hypothetical protein
MDSSCAQSVIAQALALVGEQPSPLRVCLRLVHVELCFTAMLVVKDAPGIERCQSFSDTVAKELTVAAGGVAVELRSLLSKASKCGIQPAPCKKIVHMVNRLRQNMATDRFRQLQQSLLSLQSAERDGYLAMFLQLSEMLLQSSLLTAKLDQGANPIINAASPLRCSKRARTSSEQAHSGAFLLGACNLLCSCVQQMHVSEVEELLAPKLSDVVRAFASHNTTPQDLVVFLQHLRHQSSTIAVQDKSLCWSCCVR